ncbi:NAD-dependent histone deacetylase sir2 [Tulasnella sp. 330]|nr:NAD-dependent histone deacetylase sir2 [Tulasnella sp. 330]
MSETDEASRTLRHQLVSKGATVINNTGRVSGLTTPVALKEQAQEIIADLKERGLMSWLQEYVIARAIPIKELLITLDASKLLRNYTQNIDTLESKMGIHNVLQCHGSFATAYCLECLREVPGIEIEQAIFAKQVPFCEVCMEALQSRKKTVKKRKRSKKKRQPWEDDSESDTDVVATRPSQECITFFGEAVTSRFDDLLEKDRAAADLLLVIGTSLKVAPVSEILTHLPHSVPQILINKTPVKHVNPDIVLLGNADEIIVHLCQQLGWELPLIDGEKQQPLELVDAKPKQGETSQVWLFNGAEPGTTNATERLNALVKGGESLPAGMEGYEKPRPLQTMASSTIQVPESSLYDANPYKRSRQS